MSVLAFIDWENVKKDMTRIKFGPLGFSLSLGIKNLLEWMKEEGGEIFDIFLFTPLHIAYTDYQLFYDHGLVATVCPKVPVGTEDAKDTVDEELRKRAEKWMTHPDITHFCLVSGDSDFVPIVMKAKGRGLKIMLSALDPTLVRDPEYPPLSKYLSELVGLSEKTGQPMIHYFSPYVPPDQRL